MKTLYKNFKLLTGVFVLAIIAVSCVPKTESMGDAGQTLVKITPQGYSLIPLDAVAATQKALAFEVRRDAHSEAALNSTTTVVVTKDDSMLEDWNDEYGTYFIPLPTSLGTTNPAPGGDGKVTLTFGPGEFVKAFIVTIPDATQFDFAEMYGIAYRLTSISGTGAFTEALGDSVLVQVMVKNKYDGTYEVQEVSPMVDILNANLTGYYPFIYELHTSGANSALAYDRDVWGDYMHPILSSGNLSGYGSFGLELFFDEITGDIIDVLNPWGNPPGNTRMPMIDPSGVNKWDEASGDIQFKYWMVQPSLVADPPPYIRTYFDEYWVYSGPR